MKILLVEDDGAIAKMLTTALTNHHYTVEVATDGAMGLEFAISNDYDLLVLDWQMPKLDGITVCRRLRSQQFQRPILLLTARDADADIVEGLDAGADDYITKPFKIDELLARIRALLRRGETPLTPARLTWGKLCLDANTAIVTYDSQIIFLSSKEYSLLELFLRQPLRVFSRSAILDRLWSIDAVPGEGTVTNLIKDLRQKLKAAGMTVDPLETIYGLGYRWRKEEQVQEADAIDRAESDGKTESHPREREDQLGDAKKNLTTVNRLLEQFREGLPGKLAVLEEALQALQHDRLTPALRQRASQEAHKLAGSLGTVGYPQGSRLARLFEQLLEDPAPLTLANATQLAHWLTALQQTLTQPPMPLTAEPAFGGSFPCVLLVDDDVDLGDRLQQDAQNWGIQLDWATDLATARTKISQMLPALVLLDLSFPGSEDGMDFLAALKPQYPALPVLVFTVRDRLNDRLQACQLGARGFLHKPIDPAQLQSAIINVLAQRQAMPPKVLIVDGAAARLTVYGDWLHAWGLQVTTLQQPTQFWDVLTTIQPDLLLLVLEQSEISSVDLCRIVRQDGLWSTLPIIVVLADQEPQSLQQALLAGADDVMHQPVLQTELVMRVSNRLERCRLRQSLTASNLTASARSLT